MSCPGSSFAESADLVQDDIGGRGPDERRAMFVVVCEILVNGRFKGRHALEGATTNPSRGDGRKEAFHLVEPAGTRRREMQGVKSHEHQRGSARGCVFDAEGGLRSDNLLGDKL